MPDPLPRSLSGLPTGGGMIASDRKWMPIVQAVETLAERFNDHVAQNWGHAYRSAWDTAIDALIAGEMVSKPTAPGGFFWALHDEAGECVRSLPLESGLIPAAFWFHYREAASLHASGMVTLEDGPGAHHAGNEFWFEQRRGIVDSLTMIGHVIAAVVSEDSVPRRASGNLPTPPKRRRGQRGRSYDDTDVVARVIASIDTGTMTASAAVAQYHEQMKGAPGGRRKRLISRLKELGRWEKR